MEFAFWNKDKLFKKLSEKDCDNTKMVTKQYKTIFDRYLLYFLFKYRLFVHV